MTALLPIVLAMVAFAFLGLKKALRVATNLARKNSTPDCSVIGRRGHSSSPSS